MIKLHKKITRHDQETKKSKNTSQYNSVACFMKHFAYFSLHIPENTLRKKFLQFENQCTEG